MFRTAKQCIGVPVGIACHKSIAVTGFGGCRADGILEIRPGQSEHASDDVILDRCNTAPAPMLVRSRGGSQRIDDLH